MPTYHILTGRINKLAIVEILSLAKSELKDIKIDTNHHIISINKEFDYTRLGMSTRVFKQDFEKSNWLEELASLIEKTRLETGKDKVIIGVNNYSQINSNKLNSLIKSKIDKKIRLILPQEKFLKYSQSYQYKQKHSYIEILLTNNGLAQMVWVNDLNAQVKRDIKKPIRDMRIGIMPINLARLLINLGVKNEESFLDPFCGTGTILAEGMNMGFKVSGSDISSSSIKATTENISWLMEEDNIPSGKMPTIDLADARKMIVKDKVIISEGYLGEIYSKAPDTKQLRANMRILCDLYLKSLDNFYNQSIVKKVVITIPCFQLPQEKEIILLPIIDHIQAIGYNIKYREFYPLIFIRPNQIVGRHILVLER